MPKLKTQRAIIYLTDREGDKVDFRVEFEPSIKKRSDHSPAVDIALDLIKIIKERYKKPLIIT